MRIANKIKLETFISKHTDAINATNRWVEIIENSDFANHNELKKTFPTADYVGNSRYVFNIKGNKYRFVVVVVFVDGYMRIKFCGTHSQYDKIKNIDTI